MMMMNGFRLFFLLAAVAGLSRPCAGAGRAIFRLRPLSGCARRPFGAYNVWDTVYGESATHEAFKDGVVLAGGNILVAGEHLGPDRAGGPALLFAEIGRNGRVLWQKRHTLPAAAAVVKLQPRDQGVMVLANINPAKERPYIWMGFFDLRGTKLAAKTLKGSGEALRAHDVEPSRDGQSYILAASSRPAGSPQPGRARLYRLNRNGAVMADKTFVPGAANAVLDLHVMDNGDVMSVGRLDDAQGRQTGWAMRLDTELRMIWQKPYSRGAAAELVKVLPLADGRLAALGTALPAGTGHRAGWVMAIGEDDGAVLWQRYLTGALHFDGRDMLVSGDRLLSVLLDGQRPAESATDEHVRLLTFDPRGRLLDSRAFFNGKGVDAYRLLRNARRERLIFGETVLHHVIEPPAGEEREPEMVVDAAGWLLAAPRVEAYDDPCKSAPRAFP